MSHIGLDERLDLNASAPPHAGQASRMVVAFSFFVALLAILASTVLYTSKSAEKKIKANTATTNSTADSHPVRLFYDRIGTDASSRQDTPAPQPTTNRPYTLEIRVTKDRKEAEALIDNLQLDGIDAYYTPMNRDGHIVYRIRRGLYTNAKEAKQAALALKKDTGIATRVTQLQ